MFELLDSDRRVIAVAYTLRGITRKVEADPIRAAFIKDESGSVIAL